MKREGRIDKESQSRLEESKCEPHLTQCSRASFHFFDVFTTLPFKSLHYGIRFSALVTVQFSRASFHFFDVSERPPSVLVVESTLHRFPALLSNFTFRSSSLQRIENIKVIAIILDFFFHFGSL